MAEEIKQELGFDASKALQTLTQLDKVMGSFEQRLGQSVKAMDAFNKKGGASVAMLKKVATEGERAAKALGKVVALSGQVAAGGGLAGGKGAGAAPLAVPGVDQYIKQMEKMYSVTDKATTAQKRSFQNSITAAAEFAAKNKISMGQVVDQSKNLDQNFTGVANNMANKLSKIEQASKKHLNAAGQATRKLTIDFQTMVRIITTQAIVRALSQLRNLIRGAVSDAVEFQTRVAEIGTIAPVQDLEDLGERVRRISDEFNTPLDTTAKGYYQTISNQIGQTTEDFDEFMSAAARFSKTSVTDLASAVNLGSGALNAYGKSASDAEATFAKFFMTIKQGRVIGAELAQGMGSVMPLAAKLNVEMEELNAALATVTIQGISADKAFTQLRGVFNSFMKPTAEMTAALRGLGFATGEDILAAHDLQTALRMVAGTTDGTAEGLAKLIPRIRGLTGGLALVGDESEHFTATMEAQEEQLKEIYDRNYKLVMETDAQKVTKELNELSNYMTTEFGEAVLAGAASTLELVGGASKLQDILAAIGPQLPNIAFGIGAIGTAMAVLAVKARLASAGLSGLIGPLGALMLVPLAMATGDYIGSRIVDTWDAEYQAFKKTMDAELELRKQKAADEISVEKQKTKEVEQVLAQGLAQSQKQYFKVADAAIESNKEILTDLKYFTGGMIAEAQRGAQAAKSAIENVGKNALASEQRVGKLRSGLDDKLFSNRIKNQEDINKVYALTDRAAELASSAASKLKAASTEDERASAEEEFRRAAAFAEQAIGIADSTDNLTLEAKALGSLESLTNKNIAAEKVYQKTLAGSLDVMAQKAKKEEKRVEELKKKQTELLEAYTLYDQESGRLLAGDEREAKLKGAHQKLLEFIKIATEGKPLDVSAMMNFANVSEQMSREMDVFRINEIVVSAQALQSLQDQLQAATKQMYAETPMARDVTALTGIELTDAVASREATAMLTDELDKLKDSKLAYTKAAWDVYGVTKDLQSAFEGVADAEGRWAIQSSKRAAAVSQDTSALAFYDAVDDAIKMLDKAAVGGEVSLGELKTTLDSLSSAEAQQSWLGGFDTGKLKTNLAGALIELGNLIKAKDAVNQVQLEAPGQRTYDQLLLRIQDIESKFTLETPKQNAQDMSTALGDATTAVSNAVSPTAQLDSHWKSIAASAQLAATASRSVVTPAMVASGGPIRYLASGGSARGTDQIPAMLSKDEFVTNAKSSRQFASQLTAINAGVQPVYRESGGTVTTIGDVSINVTEAQSAQKTGREVMKSFRREMRRGSGRL